MKSAAGKFKVKIRKAVNIQITGMVCVCVCVVCWTQEEPKWK